jgi:hypothetical protein
MSRKRSSYRPRALLRNPLTMLRPASPTSKAKLMLVFLTALDAMTNGEHPGEEEWRSLSDAVNTVETMALHLGKLDKAEVMPTVTAAIAGMVRAARRFDAGQGMRLDAEGLKALREVIDIYGQCLDGYTEREMAMAQAETDRRMRELLRNRKQSHQLVMV